VPPETSGGSTAGPSGHSAAPTETDPRSSVLGIAAYTSSLLAFGYAAYCFGLFQLQPPAKPATSSLLGGLSNVALLLLFGLQHSLMARNGIKARLGSGDGSVNYRRVYVIASSVALGLLLWAWRPLPFDVWSVEAPALRLALLGLGWCGAIILAVATFAHDHFGLFGLRPASASERFSTPQLYRFVRHPMMTGLLILLWATPDMTGGRALLAAGLTLYIFIGVRFEERDLLHRFGEQYQRYRQNVGKFFPRIGP
jgi:methanethiol S-methyltransferase